jgi:hypothetical protein
MSVGVDREHHRRKAMVSAVQPIDYLSEKVPSEKGANFMLAVVKGIEPRDQIEAMLAAQWQPSIWLALAT